MAQLEYARPSHVSVMGILNLTPDSFSDGGQFLKPLSAHRHAERMVFEGADIIDIGAESTRPGALPIPGAEQLRRIGPVLRDLVRSGIACSIDTTDPLVARQALSDGATLVNSVSLSAAYPLATIVSQYNAQLLLMHCRGEMKDMADFSHYPESGYSDVVKEVASEWLCARDEAIRGNLASDRILFDPGLGFSKSAAQSAELCARLGEFRHLAKTIAVGPSRKSFIAFNTCKPGQAADPEQRLGGTIAAVLECVRNGAAIVRVHDVAPVVQALRMDLVFAHARDRIDLVGDSVGIAP